MADINFEIKKHIGIISNGSRGWNRELNIVSWDDRAPKYDIREWNEDHTRMSRGITLTTEEAEALMEALKKELC